ncbi:hypothetical protein OB920_13510 [Halobacteria archaeon HArc-gm2]|nr:hypothetical protein [Halobacteria archaeon HArc-gm2]
MAPVIGAVLALLLTVLVALIVGIRYRRDAVSTGRAMFSAGLLLAGVSAMLNGLSIGGPIASGTTVNHVVDALSLLAALASVYALYRGWRIGWETDPVAEG